MENIVENFEPVEHNLEHGPYTKRKITNKIILHCSASKEGVDWSVESINKFHRQKGWTAIGYHYIIYRDGSIHIGRPEWAVGAHTVGQNSVSIGICYIGGVGKDGKAKDTRTYEQKNAMYHLVRHLLDKYESATVHGHYEFQNKACPSFNVKDWLVETNLVKDYERLKK